MVELIKPKLTNFGNEKNKEEVKSQIPTDPKGIKEYLQVIPNPVGYRMLVRPWSGQAKTKGGVILTEETSEKIQMTTVVGLVVKMGDLCYQDKDRYPTGPWCEEKDWVIFARYAGSRMEIDGGEIRMLNDDEILGTIENPEDLIHAM